VSFEALPPFGGEGEGRDGEAARTYAGWGPRAVAYIVDGLILALVAYLVATVFGVHHIFNGLPKHGAKRVSVRGGGLVAFSLIDDVILFAYATWLLASKWRATLGMRLVSIHIEDSGARVLTIGRLAGRSGIVLGAAVVSLLFPPLLLAILVDLLWPLWDSQRQTLHDKLVGTVVRVGRVG
jgi:uncharacterized RDD family membrane protein YckC